MSYLEELINNFDDWIPYIIFAFIVIIPIVKSVREKIASGSWEQKMKVAAQSIGYSYVEESSKTGNNKALHVLKGSLKGFASRVYYRNEKKGKEIHRYTIFEVTVHGVTFPGFTISTINSSFTKYLNRWFGGGSQLKFGDDNCMLYELYASERVGDGFEAGSVAVFDLKTNALRTDNWPSPIDEEYGLTSADAAGLPILPGLIRYDEVQAGAMNHAIRFTASTTRRDWIYPATHQAGSTDDINAPAMGQRVRLKSDYDISGYTGDARVILEAMKKYGMILADNGSNWYFQGSQDSRWDDDDLNQLKNVPGSAFEVVDTSSINAESVNVTEPTEPTEPTPFSDVYSTHVNFDAITYVKSEGIVEGYEDGTYRPNQTINRAEFTKIIVGSAFDYSSDQDPSDYDIFSLSGLSFSDLVSGQWYNPYLRKAVENGVIEGYPDGSFKPEGEINFAEAAKIVVISFGYEHGTDPIWYKPYVDVLSNKDAIPLSIKSNDQKITRGEMAEIVYRLLN